jgi:hypothetical protein
MEGVGIFYGHLVNFQAILYILHVFWYVVRRKILQPYSGHLIIHLTPLFLFHFESGRKSFFSEKLNAKTRLQFQVF